MVAYSTRSPGPVWAELRGLGEEAKAAVSSSAYWTSQSLWPEFWRQERRNACEEWGSPKKKNNIFMREWETDWHGEWERQRRMRGKQKKIRVCEHQVVMWRVWLSLQRVLESTVTWGDGTVRWFWQMWQTWRRHRENNGQRENTGTEMKGQRCRRTWFSPWICSHLSYFGYGDRENSAVVVRLRFI